MVRFLGSFALALVVVGVMLALGVRVNNMFEPEDPGMKFHDVDLLTAVERARFADELGENRARSAPQLPPLKEIPAVTIERESQGFVQLEVVVDESGEVSDVRVLGATPPGVYENRAVEEVRARRYPPASNGTERMLEIVEFTVPASSPQD